MGSEAEAAPKLAIHSLPIPGIKSDIMMMAASTPPHHSASVPFRWEEQPGKPRPPCKTPVSSLPSELRRLQLPPSLLYLSKFTKTPSSDDVESNEDEGSFVFSHSKRSAPVLSLTKSVRSNFWATIYGAIKQAMRSPRRRRNHN